MMRGNLAIFEQFDLGQLAESLEAAERAVLPLLEKRSEVEDRLEEIKAFDDVMDRLERAAVLHDECQVFIARCKAMEEALKNAKKRVEKAKVEIDKRLIEEVDPFEDGKVETRNHAFAIRKTPAKVIVKDKEKVPKKYRSEPKPLPPWQKWEIDKNYVKNALTKERVKSIPGIELDESGRRIEVKAL